MATGKVARIIRERGFGFIQVDAEKGQRKPEDVFFHRSALMAEPGFTFETLNEGTRVEFDIGETIKGTRAENITRE